jgi:hypothetical protein
MTFELITALLLLLASTLAAPIADSEQTAAPFPTKPFTLTIAHNPDTALNGQKINAADLALYLGLASPSTYCPSTVPPSDCPAGTETVFSGLLNMVS